MTITPKQVDLIHTTAHVTRALFEHCTVSIGDRFGFGEDCVVSELTLPVASLLCQLEEIVSSQSPDLDNYRAGVWTYEVVEALGEALAVQINEGIDITDALERRLVVEAFLSPTYWQDLPQRIADQARSLVVALKI